MSWTDLPTNYYDATWQGNRKYTIKLVDGSAERTYTNSDIIDTTSYDPAPQGGNTSFYGANDANQTNDAINKLVGAMGNDINNIVLPISHGGTGATNAADALNNLGIPVEYGTWTPKLTNRGQDPDPTYTLGAMEATYAKIGKLVFITMYLKVSITNTGGSTGYCGIGGLPFVNSTRVAMSVYEFDSNLLGTADIVRCGIPKNSNVIIVSDKYGMYAMKWRKCNNANISMSGFYRIN